MQNGSESGNTRLSRHNPIWHWDGASWMSPPIVFPCQTSSSPLLRVFPRPFGDGSMFLPIVNGWSIVEIGWPITVFADGRFELNLASGEHVAYQGWEWREWRRDLSTQETEGMLYRRRASRMDIWARFRVPEVRIGRFTVVCWPFVPLGGRRSAFFLGGGGGNYFCRHHHVRCIHRDLLLRQRRKGNKPFLNSSRTSGYAISDPGPGSGMMVHDWCIKWEVAGSPILRPWSLCRLVHNVSYYFHVSCCEMEVMTIDIAGIRAG